MIPGPVALRETVIRSATKEVTIGHNRPFCVIGERINPTGRKIFQEQLRAGDLSAIDRDVAAQVAGGADVLDVNMGVPLTDEAQLLDAAVRRIQAQPDLPICIDSSVVEALEAGLAAYNGRALVNSLRGAASANQAMRLMLLEAPDREQLIEDAKEEARDTGERLPRLLVVNVADNPDRLDDPILNGLVPNLHDPSARRYEFVDA